MQFVLLEHDVTQPGTDPEERDAHWDLLLEVPDQERLATWRLAENPLDAGHPIAAERIQDHRRLYLEFEGAVSGGRGVVRRVDRGDVEVWHISDTDARFTLNGQALRGDYEIIADHARDGLFRSLS